MDGGADEGAPSFVLFGGIPLTINDLSRMRRFALVRGSPVSVDDGVCGEVDGSISALGVVEIVSLIRASCCYHGQ